MKGFLDWFNADAEIDPVLKAAVAHLWFVTIHPFDDGNGRIARAAADLCLARSEQSAQRFYSMSSQIRLENKGYYDILEATQKNRTDVTPWLHWFLDCLGHAIESADTLLGSVREKARFWESISASPVNHRQRAVLNRLLDGFEGKRTKSSQDTARRDITALVEKGILVRSKEGGRSTSYALAPRKAETP